MKKKLVKKKRIQISNINSYKSIMQDGIPLKKLNKAGNSNTLFLGLCHDYRLDTGETLSVPCSVDGYDYG